MTSYRVNARSRERDRLDRLSDTDISPRLKLSGVVPESAVDGPGYRYAVFAQGCPHGCPGCHNPQTHNFEGGFISSVDRIISAISNQKLISGITLSGGEPFCQADAFADLALKARGLGLHVVTYTGYTFEQIAKANRSEWNKLCAASDWLIDGPFIAAQRSLMLRFRGSRNQRLIDVAATLKNNRIIEVSLKGR